MLTLHREGEITHPELVALQPALLPLDGSRWGITGLDTLMPVAASVEEALNVLTKDD
jgi:hypothetical protein